MNLTYTGSRTKYGQFTNNTSSLNLSLGDDMINQYTLELVHEFPFLFSEQTFTLTSYPSQQFYTIPLRLRKVNTLTVTVGNFIWPAEEAPSLEYWNQLNLTSNITSDIPLYYFYFNGQVGLYPRPASGYNTITLKGQIEVTGVSVADYTTGTISAMPYVLTLTGSLASGATSATLSSTWTLTTGTYQMIFSSGDNKLVTLTNGSAAVTWSSALTAAATASVTVRTAAGGDIATGSGTTWTTAMQARVFEIDQPTGDGFWYTIDTVYDTTHLSILGSYGGASIASGASTHIIGQASILPPAYQFLPIYRAAEFYYTAISKDEARATKYKELATNLKAVMKQDMGNKDTDPTVNDDFGRQIINPNLTISTTDSSNV